MATEPAFVVTGAASGNRSCHRRALIERGYRVLSSTSRSHGQVAEHTSCDLSTPLLSTSPSRASQRRFSALLNIAGVPGTVGAEKNYARQSVGLRH